MNCKTLIAITVLALTIFSQTAVVKADNPTLKTIRANSYIDQSIAVAKELNSQSNTYIITTTNDYPDALAGAVLASKLNAPILFVAGYGKEKIIDYLASQKVNKDTQFYILGGAGAVPPAVETALRTVSLSSKIVRLGGWTRYDTANLINSYINAKAGTPVIIATGRNYPDALSMAAIGGQMQYPIFLVDENGVSQNAAQQLKDIQPTSVYIGGGTAVVSLDTENQIKNLLPSTNIVRLAGIDRYETSAKISDYFKTYLKETIYTTGEDFHSALIAAPLAAQHKASITLVDKVSPEQQTTMNQQTGYIIGDISVNTPTTLSQNSGPALTSLSDADIEYLQSFKLPLAWGMVESFQYRYENDRANCEGIVNTFSPITLNDYTINLTDYSGAKAEWLTSPKLIYGNFYGHNCIRGILTLTYAAENKFGLTPNVKYQVAVQYTLADHYVKGASGKELRRIDYLSDFRKVE